MGEVCPDALRVGFDRAIELEFHGAKVSSDAGLFPYRDLDEAAQLTMRSDRASRPPSWGRTRPVTVDSGQKQATGTWVSREGRYTRARKARRGAGRGSNENVG